MKNLLKNLENTINKTINNLLKNYVIFNLIFYFCIFVSLSIVNNIKYKAFLFTLITIFGNYIQFYISKKYKITEFYIINKFILGINFVTLIFVLIFPYNIYLVATIDIITIFSNKPNNIYKFKDK